MAAVFVAAAMPAPAMASHGYWDWHNYLPAGDWYQEAPGGLTWNTDWGHRLNRSNCNAKMQYFSEVSGWDQVEIPGGCSTTDHTDWIYTWSLYGAWYIRTINTEHSTVWANVRIATTI